MFTIPEFEGFGPTFGGKFAKVYLSPLRGSTSGIASKPTYSPAVRLPTRSWRALGALDRDYRERIAPPGRIYYVPLIYYPAVCTLHHFRPGLG